MNETVLRAEPQPSASTGVAIGVFRCHAVHRRPTADVTPVEICLQSQNLAFGAGFFHDGVIDGQVRHLLIFARDDGAQLGTRIGQRFSRGGALDRFQSRGDHRLIAGEELK